MRMLLVALFILSCCGFGAVANGTAAEPTPPTGAAIPAAVPELTTKLSDYRIYAGDLLVVSVFDHPDLSLEVRVPGDGRLAYPLIGDLANLIGRTMGELQQELVTRLEKDYITRAVITISVKEFGVRECFVMGQVTKPGAVALNPLHQVSALQAIGLAGGLNNDANSAGAMVLRDDPAKPGFKITLPIPYTVESVRTGADIILIPGDVVVVPRLDRAYVIGQVNRSGAVDLPSGAGVTVSKAVSLAGGFTRFANESNVQLVRVGVPAKSVDVQAILAGKEGAEDPVMRPGDTVFVPASRF
jgi:polysaccharide export outer membrane protein